MTATTELISSTELARIHKEKFSFLFSSEPTDEVATHKLSIPAGLLLDAKIKLGTTAPNSVTVTITDSDGVVILTGTLTADGVLPPLDGPVPFLGQLTITISGNTTANALGDCMVYVGEM